MAPSAFSGSVPEHYDGCLGPVLFEPFAVEVSKRVKEPMSSILELACGTGRLTRHLLIRLSRGGRLTASDIDEDMLRLGRALVEDERLEWLLADAQELPLPESAFDLVACNFGFVFFPDRHRAFAESFRVLRRGGQLIFTSWDDLGANPRANVLAEVLDAVLGREGHRYRERGPYSFADGKNIRHLAAAAGFEEIQFETIRLPLPAADEEIWCRGFIEGSPLAGFLDRKGTEVCRKVEEGLRRGMQDLAKFSEGNSYMQAHIVSARKPLV